MTTANGNGTIDSGLAPWKRWAQHPNIKALALLGLAALWSASALAEISAPSTSSGSYTVRWKELTGATYYNLKESTDGGVTWTKHNTGASLFKSFTGKAPGTYTYDVESCLQISFFGSVQTVCTSAHDTRGWPYAVTTVDASEPPSTPSAPSSLTAPATDTDGSYEVSWASSTGAASYRLQERSGSGAWAEVHNGPATSKAFTGKASGAYSYRLEACLDLGSLGGLSCSPSGGPLTVRVVRAATGTISASPNPCILAPGQTTCSSTISWSSSHASAPCVVIQTGQKFACAASGSKKATWITANRSTFSLKDSGRTLASVSVNGIRRPTVNLLFHPSSVVSGDSAELTWSSTDATGCRGVPEERTSKGAARSKAFSNKANGTYSYRARACAGSANCSAWTDIKAIMVSTVAAGLSATPNPSTDGSYTVSWKDPEVGNSFRLYESSDDGDTWALVYSGPKLSKVFSGKTDGVYTYRLDACSDRETVGGRIICIPVSGELPVRVEIGLGTPTVTAPAMSHTGSYDVSWSAVGKATRYELEENADNGAWEEVYDGADLSKSFTGKANGTYRYRARACNADGCGDRSAAVQVKVQRTPPVPVLTAPAIDADGSYTVSWTASPGASSYRLQERPGKGAWAEVHDGPARLKALSGRSAGVYSYRAKACAGGANCSAWSKQKSVRVPATNPDKVATLVVETPPAPYDARPSLVTQAERDRMDQAGSINGAFRVSESGAATYSVPITTFAGTAGVAPQLALSYNSQAGNGPVGLGWALDGASAIIRCRATKHQDAQPKPIQWNAEDRFCLDGQRLVLENPAGIYGAVGAKYRTEVDGFAGIQAKGGTPGHPDYFEVRRKDGSTSYYGNTPGASHSDAKQANGAGQTLKWAIKQFQDSVGNPIKYEYHNDADGHRIAYVRYAYDKANRSHAHVEFAYEPRKDHLTGYVAGHKFTARQRLGTVRSHNENRPLREYRLEYENVGDRLDKTSKLQRIRECVGNLCLPATAFEWRASTTGFRTDAAGGGEVNLTPRKDRGVLTYQPADINGDGNLDLAWLEWDADKGGDTDHHLKYALFNGFRLQTTTFANGAASIELYEDVGRAQNVRMRTIDYNGDGRSDVAVWRSRDPVWKVYLSQPQTDGTWRLEAIPLPTSVTEKSADFADVDGDGLVDAVYTEKDTIYAQHLRHDPGEAVGSTHYYHFGPRVRLHTMMSPKVPSIAGLHKVGNSSVTASNFDFNGDGLADFLATFTFEGPAVPTKPERVVRGPLVSNANGDWVLRKDFGLQNLHPVDLNRDGLTDLVSSETSGDDIEFHVQINNGTGFTIQTQGIRLHKDDDAFLEFMDHNGDGHPDFVWHDRDAKWIKAYLWSPEAQAFDTSAASSVHATEGKKTAAHLFFDVNGDGATDYLRLRKDKLATHLSNNTGKTHNAITKITNGLGAETQVAYETLSRTGHYDRLDLGGASTTATSCYDSMVWSGCYTLPVTSVDSKNIVDFYTKLNGGWALPSGAQTLGKVGPVLELTGPIPVVTRVEGSAPLPDDANARSAIEYFYAEAKVQAMGRAGACSASSGCAPRTCRRGLRPPPPIGRTSRSRACRSIGRTSRSRACRSAPGHRPTRVGC